MKKLLFTIFFLSAISFIGISKVSALPSGGVLDQWDSRKVFQGQFYTNTGATMPFYSYNGVGGMSCPYLDIVNELSPIACYNDPTFYRSPGQGSSFLVNSYPLCTTGNCTTGNSVVNMVILLNEQHYLQPGVTYHVEWDIGVRADFINHLDTILKTARNIQNSEGVVTNVSVKCYLESASKFGRPYCSLSYDYIPSKLYPNVSFDLDSGFSLAEFNYNIEWLLYPMIYTNAIVDLNKYTLRPNEKAFISGIREGSIYYPSSYYYNNKPYAMYFDKEAKAQESYNWLNYPEFTYDDEYFYNSFYISEPNDLIMVSTEKWNDTSGGYPNSKLEFYVPKNAFVDIIVPQYVEGGMIQNFKYKDPNTGLITNITNNTSYFPSFDDENVNTIFQTIFNVENNNGFLDNFSEYWEKFKDSKIKSYFLLICFGGLGIYIVKALSR